MDELSPTNPVAPEPAETPPNKNAKIILNKHQPQAYSTIEAPPAPAGGFRPGAKPGRLLIEK